MAPDARGMVLISWKIPLAEWVIWEGGGCKCSLEADGKAMNVTLSEWIG